MYRGNKTTRSNILFSRDLMIGFDACVMLELVIGTRQRNLYTGEYHNACIPCALCIILCSQGRNPIQLLR